MERIVLFLLHVPSISMDNLIGEILCVARWLDGPMVSVGRWLAFDVSEMPLCGVCNVTDLPVTTGRPSYAW